MCAPATELWVALTSGSRDSFVSTETAEGTFLHTRGDVTNTLSILRDELEGKVFSKETGVMSE